MKILGLLRKALSSLLKYYSDAHNLHPLKNCNPMTCMWTNLVCKQQNIQKSFVILKTGKQTNKSKSCTFDCPFHVYFILPSANSNDSFTFYLVLAFSIGWIILHFTSAKPSSLSTAFSWSAYVVYTRNHMLLMSKQYSTVCINHLIYLFDHWRTFAYFCILAIMFKYLCKHLHVVLYTYLFSILLDMFLGVELFSYLINLIALKNSKSIYKVVALFSTPTCNYVRLFAPCHLILISVLLLLLLLFWP